MSPPADAAGAAGAVVACAGLRLLGRSEAGGFVAELVESCLLLRPTLIELLAPGVEKALHARESGDGVVVARVGFVEQLLSTGGVERLVVAVKSSTPAPVSL